MSTVLVRRIASTPVRTATQTWETIVEIIAPNLNSAARAELAKAAGVACSSISSEAMKDAAIVVWGGGGPRVRVYCLFDEDAITQEDVNEDALPQSPTEGDWKMSIPCLPEDVKWSVANLGSGPISARAMDTEVDDEVVKIEAATAPMSINLGEFLKS
jgi:hypothetical protein